MAISEISEHTKRVFSQVIVYPDSDGQPMADNTLQLLWIVMLFDNLRSIFDRDHTFVAADLLWYPVKGDPKIRVAPDVLVVFGRPDGYRGSYKQWLEEGVAPQVVIEIISPSNTAREMLNKLSFYEKYGVEEFIILDPEKPGFRCYVKKGEKLLEDNESQKEWGSPKLGIRFSIENGALKAKYSDGTPFKSFTELKEEKELAEAEKESAEAEKESAVAEKASALIEIEKLKARLRELGEDI